LIRRGDSVPGLKPPEIPEPPTDSSGCRDHCQ
jgi:hypothetical protein